MKKLIILALSALLICCQNSKIDYSYPENPDIIRRQRYGKFFDDITLFGGKKEQEEKVTKKSEVKNPLWQASIEVIGELLPIAIADSNSGLITTEWYQDGKNQGKRIKINLLVKGKEIKKENLTLSIFKQNKDKKDNWVDEKSADQSLTADLIKGKIIEHAYSNIGNF